MAPKEVDVLAGLARLRVAADDGRLQEVAERLGVRVLGVFGSAVCPGAAAPGDLDISVGFLGPPHELALLDAFTQLTATDRLDLLVLDGADPLARADGLSGIGLFEAAPGAWAIEQIAALAEQRDTVRLRALDRRALREAPAGPDPEVLGRRLRALRDALADLEELRDVAIARLRAEPLTRAAAERLLQVVVDLAIDVNAHLVVTALGRAPTTGRESFILLADVGTIDHHLADPRPPHWPAQRARAPLHGYSRRARRGRHRARARRPRGLRSCRRRSSGLTCPLDVSMGWHCPRTRGSLVREVGHPAPGFGVPCTPRASPPPRAGRCLAEVGVDAIGGRADEPALRIDGANAERDLAEHADEQAAEDREAPL